jgi:hypothetical protein
MLLAQLLVEVLDVQIEVRLLVKPQDLFHGRQWHSPLARLPFAPMISAASHHVSFLAIAFNSTSCSFIVSFRQGCVVSVGIPDRHIPAPEPANEGSDHNRAGGARINGADEE